MEGGGLVKIAGNSLIDCPLLPCISLASLLAPVPVPVSVSVFVSVSVSVSVSVRLCACKPVSL